CVFNCGLVNMAASTVSPIITSHAGVLIADCLNWAKPELGEAMSSLSEAKDQEPNLRIAELGRRTHSQISNTMTESVPSRLRGPTSEAPPGPSKAYIPPFKLWLAAGVSR